MLKEYRLEHLGKKYKIVEPIIVEVAAIKDGSRLYYWATVKNLQNELVFGIGKTINTAINMLTQMLTNYYDNLLSSDFDKLSEENIVDRKMLSRKIHGS